MEQIPENSSGINDDAPKFEPEKETLLLVEGNDEKIVFNTWFQGIGLDIQIYSYEGKEKLPSKLRLLAGLGAFSDESIVKTVGITMDADNDADAAFNSICSALENCGLAVPKKMMEIVKGPPRVSVYILPDNKNSGCLETLFYNMSDNTAVKDCVEKYYSCLKETATELKWPWKTKAVALLSGLLAKYPYLGRAAQKNLWDWDSPVMAPLKEWFESLLNQAAS